ncbi:MAG: hypothetical protein O2955_01965 [Planctomycetota bacterium]|nr:hypothetical protein [Planctomycetota bacterium]MDA1211248.1 hypothetical protein [Planctomycetota bacterium]
MVLTRLETKVFFGLLLVVGPFISVSINAEECAAPTSRTLSDFCNADGHAPDGTDSDRDDTPALLSAFAEGPGVVSIGPGYYRFGDVTIPEGVTVTGAGPATIIRSNGAKNVFLQSDVHRWRLRDVTLDGEAEGSWEERLDDGAVGLRIERCYEFEVSGVIARGFNGAGLQLNHFGPDSRANGVGSLDRISAYENFVGIRFDERAEYVTASQLLCFRNVIGCAIHSGNLKITASNFCDNVTGMLIEDKINGSHGSIGNCMFNNNLEHALICRNVEHGMAITGCQFAYSRLLIENCKGVNITNGILSLPIVVSGEHVNRFAGNYVVPKYTTYEFSPATIVQDNFTADGLWEANGK